MLSLEEIAKINNLIANCNEMIDGKFILADYKIIAILNSIDASEELYNLISNCVTNFNFEREFSQACLKNSPAKKISLPQEPEKILAFVFCVLVKIKKKELDLDALLSEYFASPEGKPEEYRNFAKEFIVPFRDIIARYFEIGNQTIIPQQEAPAYNNEEQVIEEYQTQTEQEMPAPEYDDDQFNMPSEVKIEQFFLEVKSICQEILLALDEDYRIKLELKENVRYITNIIIEDCEKRDLTHTLALVTAYGYMTVKIRSIKFYTRELNRILYDLYEE